jgi:protein-S-isoprenylcysteine O-methyltransferase Ste14
VRMLSRIAVLFVLAPLLLLIVVGDFFSRRPLVIAGQLAAIALLIGARRSFAPGQFRVGPGPAGETIINRGPYRYIRHPMYAGALLLLWTTVLGHWSAFRGLLALTASVAVAIRIRDEESVLQERCPGYAEYARKTKRLIPGIL